MRCGDETARALVRRGSAAPTSDPTSSPVLFANADFVRRVRDLAAGVPDLRLVVIDGRSVPSIDVTASGMLVQLRTDLRRSGAELVLAEDIGQVRDVLAAAEPEREPPLHPTFEAALAPVPPPAPSRSTGDPDAGDASSFTENG